MNAIQKYTFKSCKARRKSRDGTSAAPPATPPPSPAAVAIIMVVVVMVVVVIMIMVVMIVVVVPVQQMAGMPVGVFTCSPCYDAYCSSLWDSQLMKINE